jgi:hypothetical protein
VVSINIDTGEQNNIHASWSLGSLSLSEAGDTLFIADSFSVTTFDTKTNTQTGQLSGNYIGSQFAVGNQLIVLDRSSPTSTDLSAASSAESGVKYIVLNESAEIIDEFWVPRTFQQQNVSISKFRNNNEMLVESFNKIAMSDL